MRRPILDDHDYVEWLEVRKHLRYRVVVSPDTLAKARTLTPQAQDLVKGLKEQASWAGFPFTLGDVSEWFDNERGVARVRTEFGAARLFLYYLPNLIQIGFVVKL